jgi:hypothetical protein
MMAQMMSTLLKFSILSLSTCSKNFRKSNYTAPKLSFFDKDKVLLERNPSTIAYSWAPSQP